MPSLLCCADAKLDRLHPIIIFFFCVAFRPTMAPFFPAVPKGFWKQFTCKGASPTLPPPFFQPRVKKIVFSSRLSRKWSAVPVGQFLSSLPSLFPSSGQRIFFLVHLFWRVIALAPFPQAPSRTLPAERHLQLLSFFWGWAAYSLFFFPPWPGIRKLSLFLSIAPNFA